MQKPISKALQGVLWMISSAILFSLMSVLVRVVAETQGVNAWKRNRLIQAGADLIIPDFHEAGKLLDWLGVGGAH